MNQQRSSYTDGNTIRVLLQRRLKALRRSIRFNVLARGVALMFVACIGLVFLSLILDRGFRLSTPARVFSVVVYLGAFVWCFWWWILHPWTVRLSYDTLADLVEKHQPQLEDRLRSSIDFLRDPKVSAPPLPGEHDPLDPEDPGLTLAMKRQVTQEALEYLDRVDVTSVVNTPRVVSAVSAALIGFAFVLAVAVPLRDTLAIWYDRNVLFLDVPWPYKTVLEVEGFADPDYTLGVPRNDQLLLRVHARGEPPDRVRIWIQYTQERRRFSLARESDMLFVFEEPEVTEPFSFVVEGGDFRSPDHHVVVLERPAVDDLSLRLEYPEYTGKASETFRGNVGEIAVPEGSTVFLDGTASKPLKGATLKTDGVDVELDISPTAPQRFTGAYQPSQGGSATLHLDDLEGVPADRFFSFYLQLVADRAPTVRARSHGVSTMVTPQAMIPLQVRADDDYLVTALGVDYTLGYRADEPEDTERRDTEESPRDAEETPSPESPSKRQGNEDFPAISTPAQRLDSDEVWDLLPLQFPTDARLDLRVTARDNDGVGQPKLGYSATQSYLIVTVERLGEDLLRREVEQRRALERALETERGVRDEVYRALDSYLKESGELDPETVKQMVGMAKTQRQLSRQLASIGQTIAHLLEEMRNNRVAEAEDTERLAAGIFVPLERLSDDEIPSTVRLLSRVREVTESELRISQGWELAQGVEHVIEELERVLDNMRRLEGFTEIVHRLRGIIKVHEESSGEARRLYDRTVESIFDESDDEDEPEGETEADSANVPASEPANEEEP